MKINDKIISLPPYISTSWAHVKALHMKEDTLVITLTDAEIISIPSLPIETIELIFLAHASYLEREANFQSNANQNRNGLFSQSIIITDPNDAMKLGLGPLEGLTGIMQHNQSQAHIPDLPKEVLQKISSIVKVMAPEELSNFPKPEPHCNCPHCQIGRAIHGIVPAEKNVGEITVEIVEDEIVKDEDLSFQQWEIKQAGENLYTVTNRLDTLEKYNVFLGEPVGCTCGKQGCEHILAVLKS